VNRNVGSQIYASILVNSILCNGKLSCDPDKYSPGPLSILAVVTFASHGTLLPVAAEGWLFS
jgi:ABC-2 type transport system permease protein